VKVWILLVAVSLSGITGCTSAPEAILRIAGNIWPGYEPLYLARDLGYFRGTAIHPIEFTSATEVMRAYQNRAVDAACLTLDEALQLASHKADFRIVYVADFSNGADVVLGKPGLRHMSDLKGRRVGMEDTALGAFMLARALQESGMQSSDVQIVPLQVQDHEQAFINGTVDAIVTFEPVRGRLLARGAAVLFDSSRIPGEIVDIVLVRTSYLRRHTDVVDYLLQAWYRAQDDMSRGTANTEARMARRFGVTPAEAHATLQGLHLLSREENRQLLGAPSPALEPVLQRLATFMWQHKLLERPVADTQLIDAPSPVSPP